VRLSIEYLRACRLRAVRLLATPGNPTIESRSEILPGGSPFFARRIGHLIYSAVPTSRAADDDPVHRIEMPRTLQEYADWLEERDDLLWPRPPKPEPANAAPYLKPLTGIRAVTWNIYGTLLRISDGELLLQVPQMLRMQIALEKTIEEFKMWGSMYRKPGAPWEAMHQQYARFVEERRLAGTRQKGDVPEVNLAEIWRKLVAQLEQKEYEYDRAFYGDADELSVKIAYFFHASLQGVEAAPNALSALTSVSNAGLTQALLADAQPFTLVQTLRALRTQGTPESPGSLFAADCSVLSSQAGIRKPSDSLYQTCLERFAAHGIEPGEVLHVSNNLRDDLAPAKQAGMRAALYAGDKLSLKATKADVLDPSLKPDRLLTDLGQIRDILNLN
jgi:FMN phosphatase YigB (HAD superfamily)